MKRIQKVTTGLLISAVLYVVGGYAQGWFDQNWLYRRSVAIANPGATVLYNHQVRITLNSSFDFAKAKSDGGDLRVTAKDALTLIPFWIETWDVGGTQAIIWAKVDTIPTAGTTIYIYYGNSGAVSTANGSSTFEFFDDFESWPVIAPAWADKQPLPTPKADPASVVYNGNLYLFGGYNAGAADTRSETYMYDPVGNTWSTKAPMPTPRWGTAAVEAGGKMYVFGGQLANGGASNLNEIYDPAYDAWVQRVQNPLPIPKDGATGVVHPDVVYFPQGKDGYKYWMAYTPYPPQPLENPSVIRSNDGLNWSTVGITNPVIPAGASGSWNGLQNADPDFLYVPEYNKWFLVWAGGDAATNSRKLALAYSSDGKTWTQYDGSPVNKNTNPMILSGTDSLNQSWERDPGGFSKTSCPTLFYENGKFYLYYYEEINGANRGKIGLATFTWNNITNSIDSLVRNPANPIINLPEDSYFKSGGGHMNVSKNPNDGLYYMHVVRELLGSVNFELSYLTSTDKTTWTDHGVILKRGAYDQWDTTHVYRSCPVVDSTGTIVFFSPDTMRLYYSGYKDQTPNIGIVDIPSTGPPLRFQGQGPTAVPAGLAAQGLMGVQYGDKIHLFYQSTHYEYDPANDTYTPKANVPTPRTWGTTAVVGSQIYLIGGYSFGNPFGASNVNEVYDPALDTWATKAVMPVRKYGMVRENPVIGGKIYVTPGADGGFHNDNFEYDPATDEWHQRQSSARFRYGSGGGVIDNKLYVVGGVDPATLTGVPFNDMYDPSLDAESPSMQWTTTGSSYVFTSDSAKKVGEKGLVVQYTNTDATPQYAQHLQNFGACAVDLKWNLTSAFGTNPSTGKPEGRILLTGNPGDGSLYFYDSTGGSSVIQWYNGVFVPLQSGTFDTWYDVTLIWSGTGSKVIINGTQYSVNIAGTPSDRIYLGTYWQTREYFDNVRVRKWAGADPATTVGEELARTVTVNCTATGVDYLFGALGITLNFSSLSAGGGNVTITRYDSQLPGPPTYPIPPGGAIYLPVWLNVVSTIPNNTFRVTISMDVNGIGFSDSSRVMYYNSSTASWVPVGGTFNSGTNKFTFTVTRFGPFGFVNVPSGGYNVYVSKDPAQASPAMIFPSSAWQGGYPARSNDWGFTGSQSLSLYLVPDAGAKVGACDLTLEWDSTAIALDSVNFGASVFAAHPELATWDTLGSRSKVRINASLVSPTNATIGAGDYLAKLKFNLKRPGYATITPIAADFRIFNEDLSQTSKFVAPVQAEVKAYLGDVASVGNESIGDARVDFNDLSPWSVSYWSGTTGYAPGMAHYKTKFDFGPTMDGTVYSLPAHLVLSVLTPGPDGKIDFEDLAIYSVSYGMSHQGQLRKLSPVPTTPVVVAVGDPTAGGGETRIPVTIKGGVADLRATSLVLTGQFGRFLGAEKGALLQSYSTPIALMSRADESRVHLDLAVMGLDAQGLNSEGELVVLRFEGKAQVAVESAICRTSQNKTLLVEAKSLAGEIPTVFGLSQNYPNPFNPTTVIEYGVPQLSRVEIAVYNVLGEKVASLLDEVKEPGNYRVSWNGTSATGQQVGTGTYFCKMRAGDHVIVRKMLLMK